MKAKKLEGKVNKCGAGFLQHSGHPASWLVCTFTLSSIEHKDPQVNYLFIYLFLYFLFFTFFKYLKQC